MSEPIDEEGAPVSLIPCVVCGELVRRDADECPHCEGREAVVPCPAGQWP